MSTNTTSAHPGLSFRGYHLASEDGLDQRLATTEPVKPSQQGHDRAYNAFGSSIECSRAALKEAERLREVLLELNELEHDVLYPLASQQISIDLDDGGRTNYPKFYPALKKIAGLEAADE